MQLSITDIFTIVSAAAVLAGVIVAIDELRHFSKVRQAEVITQIQAHIFHVKFLENWILLMNMKQKTFDEIRGKPEEVALYQWISFLEGLALLVKREVIPLDVVDDYFHGVVRLTWLKVEPIVRNYREVYKFPEFGEWVEYLYERVYVKGELKARHGSESQNVVYSRRIGPKGDGTR